MKEHDERPSGIIEKIMGWICMIFTIIIGASCAVFMPRYLKLKRRKRAKVIMHS